MSMTGPSLGIKGTRHARRVSWRRAIVALESTPGSPMYWHYSGVTDGEQSRQGKETASKSPSMGSRRAGQAGEPMAWLPGGAKAKRGGYGR
jgi:hypothetical protein